MMLESTESLQRVRQSVAMKTRELTGKPLRYAVAEAEGFNPRNIYGFVVDMFLPKYDSDWSQGADHRARGLFLKAGPDLHLARIDLGEGDAMLHKATGPTKLVAAMRCFLVSVQGERVNIPEELLA